MTAEVFTELRRSTRTSRQPAALLRAAARRPDGASRASRRPPSASPCRSTARRPAQQRLSDRGPRRRTTPTAAPHGRLQVVVARLLPDARHDAASRGRAFTDADDARRAAGGDHQPVDGAPYSATPIRSAARVARQRHDLARPIVGIVNDVKQYGLDEQPTDELYRRSARRGGARRGAARAHRRRPAARRRSHPRRSCTASIRNSR